jgi:hypothetical protein
MAGARVARRLVVRHVLGDQAEDVEAALAGVVGLHAGAAEDGEVVGAHVRRERLAHEGAVLGVELEVAGAVDAVVGARDERGAGDGDLADGESGEEEQRGGGATHQVLEAEGGQERGGDEEGHDEAVEAHEVATDGDGVAEVDRREEEAEAAESAMTPDAGGDEGDGVEGARLGEPLPDVVEAVRAHGGAVARGRCRRRP